MFFHPPGERGVPRDEREASAKAICRSCPVVQECLAHSLAVQEPYGVWGGLSEGERQSVLAHPERPGSAYQAAADAAPGARTGGGPRKE